MKAGVIFESNTELEQCIPVMFIEETWCNYPPSFDSLPIAKQEELEAQGVDEWDYDHREITLDMLPITTRVRLKENGCTEEQFNMCKHLIDRTKKWSLKTGIPYNYVMDAVEIKQWELLKLFTQIVANV